MKRKKQRKLQSKSLEKKVKSAAGARPSKTMPVPELMIKILAVILTIILIIALTLYVLGRMPARGFWTLAVMLAVIAFFIMPAMRRKFVEQG
jgi:membrane protein YdbS with pleckstrin-like domain